MLRRLPLLVGAIVAPIAIIVAASYWLGDDSSRTTSSIHNAQTTTQLAAGFEDRLSDMGITYTLLGDPASGKASDAYESVLGGFDAVLEGQPEYVVEHVKFTDENYGPVKDPDAPDPTVTPYFKDREALMVVLAHQAMPLSGPPGVDKPESVDSTFVAFVDMESLQVLQAVSFSS